MPESLWRGVRKSRLGRGGFHSARLALPGLAVAGARVAGAAVIGAVMIGPAGERGRM